jgi:hypothetical protein
MEPIQLSEFLFRWIAFAFLTCEAIIAIALIWVYGRFAIRHILAIGRKDK